MSALDHRSLSEIPTSFQSQPSVGSLGMGSRWDHGDLSEGDGAGYYTSCSPFEYVEEDEGASEESGKVISIASSPDFGTEAGQCPESRYGFTEMDLFGSAEFKNDDALEDGHLALGSDPDSDYSIEYGGGGGGEEPPRSQFFCGGYDKEIIESVWETAQCVEGNDDSLWRRDEFGAWIYRLDYGRRHSQFGWEISDLNTGRSDGGVTALRPMHWQNYLDQVVSSTQSRITAEGLRNIRK